jgi:flagellar basal-body rod protein FlgC
MDFSKSLAVAASGMRAQTDRMKIIAENIANASSTASVKGGDPYRRKIATIAPDFDRELNATLVQAGKPLTDKSDFKSQYDPGNPMADAQGYVKLPNVDSLVEVMDMREAQRSYSANLSVLETTRGMLTRTIEALRG